MKRLTLFSLILCTLSFSALSCDMVMGYRTSERLPLIAEHPNKQGLYFSLYQQALTNIGCTLTVIRAPKKRILKMLADGEVDLYPGMGYSLERDKYLLFFENGLMVNTVAISHIDTAEIHQISGMRDKTLLTAIGSNRSPINNDGIHLRQAHDVSIKSAFNLLVSKRVDFFLDDEAHIRYYIKLHPTKEIRFHPCCSTPQPMLLGFSKKSKYAQIIPNPNFSKLLPYSAKNSTQILSPISKAFAFKEALKKIKDNGTVTKLELFYYR
ncbi:hypothetical protein CXF85_10285 [Colwellia sp. 75C3]|uniref:substrate-binding periplasmic protein n=1 Tax=Colwellia sp. 75C3 TaxID=888425 RepID=UPI000C32F22E|nr:transporter substrate-binding domain-containing protein [Colwellia sp. 75C3]PKG83875.1 hypothetical protein CXF85_10285 [Colwellia sp. 75C3]